MSTDDRLTAALFASEPRIPDVANLDTLDVRCQQFIARWGWKENLTAMRAELDELIDVAVDQAQRTEPPI